jgi:MFS family permease
MWQIIKSRLSPFQHEGFRNFFFAQNISLVGTWSHELARSWLVLSISGSATALGSVLLATSLPGLFLSFHGGVIADRVDVKKFLIVTKIILAAASFALFLITEFYTISIPIIIFFGVIEGIVNSYDSPAFTSMFARIVPRNDFQQALAIQSSNFHSARMLGPVVAGLLMAWKGPSIVFLFDAISYLGVIYVIKNLELRPKATKTGETVVEEAKESIEKTHRKILKMFDGIRFFFKNRDMRFKLFQLFLSLGLIMPVITVVFRTYMKQKFELDASEFGFLFAFPAVGSMLGAIYFILAKKERPYDNIKWAIPGLVLMLLLIHFAPDPYTTATLLAVCGFFSYVNIAAITQSMHLEVEDHYRGRLGSLIGLGFMTLGPLMSFPVGLYTDAFGYNAGIIHFTLFFALGSAVLAVLHRRHHTVISP